MKDAPPVPAGPAAEAVTTNVPIADASNVSARPLSREEQMARFEEALKEEDWGHQPC